MSRAFLNVHTSPVYLWPLPIRTKSERFEWLPARPIWDLCSETD